MSVVWLIGSGAMARDYMPVLEALDCSTIVFGREGPRASRFREETGLPVNTQPIAQYQGKTADVAIVCVSTNQLSVVASEVISAGVKDVLVEKPAALTLPDLVALRDQAKAKGARVFIGYNRRHFAAVEAAREIINEDGGVTSFVMELTEWAHVIGGLEKASEELERWFLANTTHVVDLAWHLCGKPVEVNAFVGGRLSWHPSARFSGAGVTSEGATFSYFGDWESAGRWSLEVSTRERRLVFRPMEALQVQMKGSIAIEPHAIDDELDQNFKPGLYRQVDRFLSGQDQYLCSIDEHIESWPWYEKMAGYQL